MFYKFRENLMDQSHSRLIKKSIPLCFYNHERNFSNVTRLIKIEFCSKNTQINFIQF